MISIPKNNQKIIFSRRSGQLAPGQSFFAGPLTSPTLTDNGDGTATISSFIISIYDNALFQGQPYSYTIEETTLSFTTNTEQYVVVDYNNGSPILRIENNKFLINGSSIITVFICWRQDNIIHSIDQAAYGYGLANKTSRYVYNTQPYRRSVDGGLILEQTNIPVERTIVVSSAVVYAGINPTLIYAFNSSIDLLTQVNHVDGVWSYTTVTQYDNQYYDNGSNLVLLVDNRYSNRFFYRSIGNVKEVFYTLGNTQYFSEDECYKELPPTPPLLLRDHCVYIGRIGIGLGSSTGIVHPEFDHIEEIPEFTFYATAGIWTEPSISTSTGVITVGTGDYIIYDDSTYDQSSLFKCTITEQTFLVPNDNITHYIIVNYNSGTPITQLITDANLINQSDIIPILTVYNLDNVILYLFWDQMAKGLSNKLCHRFVKTERFKVQPGGLQLGEQATRIVTITAGTVWYGACFNDLIALNSSVAGQEIAFWYHVSGVWTKATTTIYNNSQYDDGTNLQNLLPNRYAVNWVYRGVSQLNNRLVIILGQGNYKLAEALESKQPLNIPPVTANFGILVGRIIVKMGANTATQIDTLYGSVEFTSITLHNGLSGIQGGAVDEYYHMTAAQHALIDATGFVNRTDSIYAMVGSDFQISPAITSFIVWTGGVQYTISAMQSVSIATDKTLHYVYFDIDGVLKVAISPPWAIDGSPAPVAIVFRDGSNYAITDERHSYQRNKQWHKWAHNSIGARFKSGFSGTFSASALSITQGTFYDEDLLHDTGGTKTTTSLWYRDAGLTTMRMTRGSSVAFALASGVLAYDDGSGTLAQVSLNNYGISWVYGTADLTEPIYTVIGQGDYASETAAINAGAPSIPLTTAEWVLLYKVIFKRTSGGTVYINAIDLRTQTTGPANTATTTNHAALTGRDALNSHPASAIAPDTTNFAGNLSATDDTVQKALDTIDDLALGTGDVVGPAGAGDSMIALFDGTTGKLLKDSSAAITDFAPAGYTGAGIDTTAIHDNEAGEISAITNKATPVAADMLLIEDSADGNKKKMITMSALPGGVDSTAIHKATASEISAITEKTIPVINDILLIEDSADSYNKKKVTVSNLVAQTYSRGVRQTVLMGLKNADGLANFITGATAITASISATAADPLVLSWANGYGVLPSDYESMLTSNVTDAWDTFTSYTSNACLYIENDGAGNLTYGHTMYNPVYAPTFRGSLAGAVLAHCEGSNGAQTFTDSYNNVALFSAANATISTGAAKFGSTSVRLAGTNGYFGLQCPRLGKYWTVEFWVRFDSIASQVIMTDNKDGVWGIRLIVGDFIAGTRFLYSFSSDGVNWNIANSGYGTKTSFTQNQWYHIALVSDGTNYKAYIDGTLDYSIASQALIQPGYMRFGLWGDGSAPMTGYVDEIQFSPYLKYTANFTPPSAVFDEAELHFFDTTRMVMYKGNPTDLWTKTLRLFVGECEVGASATITSVVTYALNGQYQSPETTIPAASTNTIFNHNIGTDNCYGNFKARCVLSEYGHSAGDMASLGQDGGSGVDWDSPVKITRNTGIWRSYNQFGLIQNMAGGYTYPTTGRWKMILTMKRNF